MVKFKSVEDIDSELSAKASPPLKTAIIPALPPHKKKITPKKFELPEFNDIIIFCKKYMAEDIELKQFYNHAAPNVKRGGGGWAGVVKNTLAVLRKMKAKGTL